MKCIPLAVTGSRAFSIGGVLWKMIFYALAYLPGFVYGRFFEFDESQYRVLLRMVQCALLALFSIVAVVFFWDGMRREGPSGALVCAASSPLCAWLRWGSCGLFWIYGQLTAVRRRTVVLGLSGWQPGT